MQAAHLIWSPRSSPGESRHSYRVAGPRCQCLYGFSGLRQRGGAIGRKLIAVPAYQPIAPLLYSWRNEHRIGSDEQGIEAMRAIMQGLTDAEFERLYGTEGQCLVAWVKARQDAGMP